MAYFICMHFISAWTSRFLCRLLHVNAYAFKLLFDNMLYFFSHLCQYKSKVLANQSFQSYCTNHFKFPTVRNISSMSIYLWNKTSTYSD